RSHPVVPGWDLTCDGPRGGGPSPRQGVRQQTLTTWNDSLARAPPKKRSARTSMPTVLLAGPLVTSTVAGLNGTAAFFEPRVAIVAQFASETFVAMTNSPVPAR